MARYFFHVHDGEDFVDLQGTELPDIQAARKEAVRFAGALLAERPEQFWEASEWTLRVADPQDVTLFELRFHATNAHASEPSSNGAGSAAGGSA